MELNDTIMPKQKIGLKTTEALITIPLSALRCILGYPNEKKIICEISTDEISRVNDEKTLDEVVSGARLDYALGNYHTHQSAKSLIADLRA